MTNDRGTLRVVLTRDLLFVVLTASALATCAGFQCEDQVTAESASPDATFIATTYVRDCGATTSYSTHVVIRRSSAPFRTWKEDSPEDHGLVFVVEDRPTLTLHWRSPTTLMVQVRGHRGRTFTKRASWEDVTIDYDGASGSVVSAEEP